MTFEKEEQNLSLFEKTLGLSDKKLIWLFYSHKNSSGCKSSKQNVQALSVFKMGTTGLSLQKKKS